MTTLVKTLRKLFFGETWLLPIGVALIVAVGGLVLRPLAAGLWHHGGGLLMLAAAVVLVLAAVERGARAAGR